MLFDLLKKIFAALVFAPLLACAGDVFYGRVLENMGYRPEKTPSEKVEITIPENWGAVYENYNQLQIHGGFDLEKYRGKKCTRYTYEMSDMPARGNVLVHNGEIIGGDICSITLDGIMLPIEKDKIK